VLFLTFSLHRLNYSEITRGQRCDGMNNSNPSVWLIDDDPAIRWVLERALRDDGLSPRTFEAAEAALQALKGETPAAMVVDIRLAGVSGLEMLRQVRNTHPELPVIVMTAHSDLSNALSAYEAGAFEYLPKRRRGRPFPSAHAGAHGSGALDAARIPSNRPSRALERHRAHHG
jgi:FixJ family two-component response regulator